MQFQKRDPVTVLLLSIITCGIYEWYCIYKISAEIRDFRGDTSINPGVELLLCIVTCGLYQIFWFYRFGTFVFDMQQRTGVPQASNISVILMILPVLGVGMISIMLLQTELNRVWDTVNLGV